MKKRTKTLLLVGGGLLAGGGLLYLATRSSSSRLMLPTGLAYGKDVSPEFRAKVTEIGKALSINPSYLMAIMKAESGINPHIHITPAGRNARGGILYRRSTNPDDITDSTIGGGLIGFMRGTAKGLGTTLWDLLHLNGVEQLSYVYKFYANHQASGILPQNPSLWELYMSTFYPAAVELANNPSAILFSYDNPVAKKRKAYFYNESADKDKDGDIEIQEAMAKIDGILLRGLKDKHRF